MAGPAVGTDGRAPAAGARPPAARRRRRAVARPLSWPRRCRSAGGRRPSAGQRPPLAWPSRRDACTGPRPPGCRGCPPRSPRRSGRRAGRRRSGGRPRPHWLEPWVERALVHVWTGDDERARQAALVAYRHHERSLHDLLGDTCSPPDPVEAVALEDHVRQASGSIGSCSSSNWRSASAHRSTGRRRGRPPAPPGWLAPTVADRRRGLRRARRDVPRRVGGRGSTAQRRHPRQAAPVGRGAGRGGPDAAVAGGAGPSGPVPPVGASGAPDRVPRAGGRRRVGAGGEPGTERHPRPRLAGVGPGRSGCDRRLWRGPVVGDGIGAVDAAGPRARPGGRRGDAAGRH